MTRFSKLKQKIEARKTPRDITYDEIQKYLNHYNFYIERINGSHHIFKDINERCITIPVHNGKIKSHYVNLIVKITKED